MADHSDFVLMAQEMIAEEGRLVTFYQLDATAVDSSKPWKGPGAPNAINPVDCFIVVVPVSSLRDLGTKEKDMDLFRQADLILLVAPPITGEDLSTYHVFDDGGERFRISVVDYARPGPTTVLYSMGAAR